MPLLSCQTISPCPSFVPQCTTSHCCAISLGYGGHFGKSRFHIRRNGKDLSLYHHTTKSPLYLADCIPPLPFSRKKVGWSLQTEPRYLAETWLQECSARNIICYQCISLFFMNISLIFQQHSSHPHHVLLRKGNKKSGKSNDFAGNLYGIDDRR